MNLDKEKLTLTVESGSIEITLDELREIYDYCDKFFNKTLHYPIGVRDSDFLKPPWDITCKSGDNLIVRAND